uniref:Uncharacterized protein n=2 Tax=Anopheles gambiae TaxID=7165 RepID=A0A1S4GS17_ANOGA
MLPTMNDFSSVRSTTMNTTVLFSVLLAGLLQSVSNKHSSLYATVGRLTKEAYRSRFHSVKQVYAVGIPDEAFGEWNAYVPMISLQEPYTIRWKLENAFVIVKISKFLTLNVLSAILSHARDVEKVFLAVIIDSPPSHHTLKQLTGMLLKRGLLNYCIIHTNTHGIEPSLLKYDTIANHFQSHDLNTSIELLFPPFLRTLEGHKLNALLSDNYPYAYLLSSVWEGVDAYILTLARESFHFEVQLINMAINRQNALHRMDLIRQRLENGTIDIHMPRAHVSRSYLNVDVAAAYEWEALVLVVPKSDQLNLINIMLQPFTIEVWTIVLAYLLVRQMIKLFSFFKRRCNRFTLKKTLTCRWSFGSFGSLTTVGVELVSFLLIEAYLAKITEFLLYCRFRSDPQTLDEFFRSTIPVLVPEYMDPLVEALGPTVAANFHAKLIRPDEYAKRAASCCARIHTLPRAEYVVRMGKYFDATLGRKQLYILPEQLTIIPMSYLVGRNFAFKNSFELFLLSVHESGLIGRYVTAHRKDMAMMERNFFTKGWLTLADLLPLFVLVGAGWCCSFAAFLSEVFGVRFNRYWARKRVRPFVAE